MVTESSRLRARFKEESRAYLSAVNPTAVQTQALCASLVEMVAVDRSEEVSVTIGSVVIRRRSAKLESR